MRHTLNKNLFFCVFVFFLRRLNNIKDVLHLQRLVIPLDRTHHSQSVFGPTDKTISLISVGEKQSSEQVQNKQSHNCHNNMLSDQVFLT